MACIKIVIPIYEAEKYLSRCLRSIANQTFLDYVVILVNDGSTDNSAEICRQFAAVDPRIYIVDQENKGLSAARNAGIDYPIDCEFITFIDSDDWVHPRYLETLLASIRQTGTQIAVCGHTRTKEEPSDFSNTILPPQQFTAEACYCLKSVSATPAWGKLYKTFLFRDTRFPEGKIHEDYYVTWKLLFQQDTVAVIDTVLYFYFHNPAGIMHSDWTPNRMDFFPALEEKILFFRTHHLHKAEERACNKAAKTAEKYIVRIEGTAYAPIYIPLLMEWKRRLSGNH